MTVNNLGKMILLGVFMVCMTVLVSTGSVEASWAAPFFTLGFGYLMGNGVAAMRGETVEPIIGKKDKGDNDEAGNT